MDHSEIEGECFNAKQQKSRESEIELTESPEEE